MKNIVKIIVIISLIVLAIFIINNLDKKELIKINKKEVKQSSPNYNNIYNIETKPYDNIVFLGDSLTEQYPIDLYFEDLPVINSGVGAQATYDLIKDLDNLVYKYNPSIVIVQAGINDMRYGKSNDEIIKGIKDIVNEIKKNRPKATVYVESLYPVNNSDNKKIDRERVDCRSNEDIVLINKALKEYYKNNYIDVHKELLDDNNLLNIDYTKDGIHITEECYIIISAAIRSHLLGLTSNTDNIYNISTESDDNIVFLGDSITHFYPIEYYYKDIPVVNSGREGYKTVDILDKMNDLVYKYNPSKVFLTIGVNDIKYNTIPQEDVIKNIKEIIKEIKENRPKAKIYVESIYPINTSDDSRINRVAVETRSQDEIRNINKELKEELKNTDVTFIDLYDELLDENNMLKLDYTKDGVHLTNKGYVKITSKLLKYIAS